VWEGDQLSGGLYGVVIGRMMFAESMFSARSGGSKVALAALCAVLEQHEFPLIDCQVVSGHLLRIGAELLPRRRFIDELRSTAAERTPFAAWPAAPLAARELA
jgi:leucyl/phenylalanyl-tRNA--protein transferase